MAATVMPRGRLLQVGGPEHAWPCTRGRLTRVARALARAVTAATTHARIHARAWPQRRLRPHARMPRGLLHLSLCPNLHSEKIVSLRSRPRSAMLAGGVQSMQQAAHDGLITVSWPPNTSHIKNYKGSVHETKGCVQEPGSNEKMARVYHKGDDEYFSVPLTATDRQAFQVMCGKRYQTHLKRKVPTFKVLKFYPILPDSTRFYLLQNFEIG